MQNRNIYTAFTIIIACAIAFLFIMQGINGSFGAASTLLPNPVLTPGVTNPTVTQANIKSTICVVGWTATIRPPSGYTTALKVKQIQQYGFADTKTADYEEDHLISLELGGNPTDPKNLWPEAYPAAHQKDKTENYLHAQVCAGKITLANAQYAISHNWPVVAVSTFGSIITSDPDDE